MNLFEAVKTCWIKYAIFSGRASRSEYWFFLLFLFLLNFVTAIIDVAVYPYVEWTPISTLVSLLTFIPSISVAARRLHDVDRSGWWQLLWITIVGIIPLLYWFIKKSNTGDNKYGSNPLQ